ncbi:MAG: hypothetical protein ACT4O1_01645 [Gemmatimonadota bacterium]
MNDTAKRRAEELTEAAITGAQLEDFRAAYRERLRWLKESQPQSFTKALSHYNDVLVPNVAEGADPIAEWIDYGTRLGELSGVGKVVRVDETGRAWPLDHNIAGLILHLPDDTGVPALALLVPRQLSDAQKATMQLLVKQKS